MAKEKSQKTEGNESNLTREYAIPLRKKFLPVPRYKKANRAVKAIKEFIVRHMQVRDRDLKKVKLDKYLNEYMWYRGIKKPPAKVKVKATKDSKTGLVHVEMVNIPEKLKYKKQREEKAEQKSQEIAQQKKQEQQSMMQKAQQTMKGSQSQQSQGKEEPQDKQSQKEESKQTSKQEEKAEQNKEKTKETKKDSSGKNKKQDTTNKKSGSKKKTTKKSGSGKKTSTKKTNEKKTSK